MISLITRNLSILMQYFIIFQLFSFKNVSLGDIIGYYFILLSAIRLQKKYEYIQISEFETIKSFGIS